MQEKSIQRCKCGYKIKGPNHEEGEQHKKGKVMRTDPNEGRKTNIGDPLKS